MRTAATSRIANPRARVEPAGLRARTIVDAHLGQAISSINILQQLLLRHPLKRINVVLKRIRSLTSQQWSRSLFREGVFAQKFGICLWHNPQLFQPRWNLDLSIHNQLEFDVLEIITLEPLVFDEVGNTIADDEDQGFKGTTSIQCLACRAPASQGIT